MKTIKKYIKIILGVMAVSLLVYAFIPNPILVDMDTVKRGDVLVTLDGEGKTKIHDIYVVYSPIEGRVTRLESEQGDTVVAGETGIANMSPADPRFVDSRAEIQAQADIQGAQAALGFEEAQLARAQAELEFSKAEYARADQLYRSGNVSIARIERADLLVKLRETELNTALSGMEVAQSVLTAAKARLFQPGDNDGDSSSLLVHAPVSGKVLRILHKSEGVIQSGTPLVEVGNPEDLEIVIEMLSRDAVLVEAGETALIKRWGGTEDITAQVRVVSPSGFTKISALGVEEQRVNIYMNFIDGPAKWRGLGDAFRVEASI
ncbi:MAG: HlyD family efflux transporter periplasmic adaptor subunit, partial [Kordiimonadaceae bacterium]|nr:HlyD family efflux transporter periplasmic adaptor subunit [Kordiimonadaceae bacterium]